jgi:DNA-binding CsgD family transcriptional regulator
MTSYLFLDPDSVPERWADRVIPMAMVPLTQPESDQVLSDEPVKPDPLTGDSDLMRLVARGVSAEVIARRLGLAPRSVYRRLARLRDEFGVASTAELATELAGHGFGLGDVAGEGTGAPQPGSNLEG